jgi:hypothetical protein
MRLDSVVGRRSIFNVSEQIEIELGWVEGELDGVGLGKVYLNLLDLLSSITQMRAWKTTNGERKSQLAMKIQPRGMRSGIRNSSEGSEVRSKRRGRV